ncbi:ABC transporter ATP-binding protein [Desulfovibrio cuneatus]|uniref:ABC transporter ATP-binding protein n=1 Tax=Desulfovibrio cuneatus TaxID=159728 RepID=UPI00040D8B79|nr:ABC transporter ATP-binding protein [Desulfovibrio cuneatus]
MTSSAASFDAANLVLDVQNIVKRREKGGMCFELRVPRLRVHVGEFVAVVGQSGCGKSTLLDMLGLVLTPDSASRFALHPRFANKGHVAIDLRHKPESVLSLLRRREIGYVLQSGGLLPYLTVGDNILLPCLMNKYPAKPSQEQAHALAALLDIAEHWEKKPAHLSGGQRQRVAIARALTHEPGLVLADEPTAAVDALTATEIRDAFKRAVQQQGIALVMVTHDRPLIEGYADTMVTFTVERPHSGLTVSTLVEVPHA